ncbi:serine/threonine-protein kinase mos [Diachasma alloeum]|uniref:serine/threonine-protein kinase mos n=1 Tax=Diachasma alloeum TaxID=454923 RepID=UPI0007383A1E|nr:serine/threonine-protein kinase mos [Diachasma alloeum]
MASSPRIVVSAITQRVLSPSPSKNFLSVRRALSPKTPTKGKSRRFLSIDTPNRVKIVEDGPPKVEENSIIGCGAFGTVYRASYKGSEVAAKIVKRRRNSDVTIRAERNAASLAHSNIIRIFGVEEGKIWSLVTMELCGTSLQDKLDETGLDRTERINTWLAISCALDFCHNAGIVHADVKPKNVLIAVDGQPKLADFGNSIVIGEEYSVSTLRGTPGYVAPEITKGSPPSPSSDIYSLGILAWQLLSRESPFSTYHPHTILYLTGKGSRPSDEGLDDECSGNYKSLYRELWSQSPECRPPLGATIDRLNAMLNTSKIM